MITMQRLKDRVLTPAAAKYIGVTPPTLTAWRLAGTAGPRYYKIGKRTFYTISDLDAFIDSCAVEPAAA